MSLSRPVTCVSRSPHVREFFRLLNLTEIKVEAVAEQIPCAPSTIYDWAGGVSHPRINNLEAAFNVLGYTLTIQPLEQDNEELPRTSHHDVVG